LPPRSLAPRLSRRSFAQSLSSAAALASFTGRPASAEPRTLTVGYVPSTLFGPLFIAQDRGYLSGGGAPAKLTAVVAGQDALALLATSQLDAIAAGLSAAFFNGVARGLDVRLVASTGYQPRTGHPSALMVREDLYAAGTRAVRDLRGKKIAYNGGAGAASAYYLVRILRTAGLNLSDVETVNINVPDQGLAFERKAIDAAFTSAPSTQAFAERKLARIVAGPPAGISATGIFLGPTLLRDPKTASALLDGCRRGAADLAGNGYVSPRTLATLATYTQQPVAVLRHSDRYDFAKDLRIDQSTLLDMQRVFLEQHVLAYARPLEASRLVARF
jgi:NitT/TauT family transport system substrate-binding protein